MKKAATTFVLFGAVIAIVQWWQICYRLRLFFVDYHGELYVNHIDGFGLIYTVNALLLLSASFACRIFQNEKLWRNAVLIVGSVNLAGWLALIVMHRTGILVEYVEFIRHMKGMK